MLAMLQTTVTSTLFAVHLMRLNSVCLLPFVCNYYNDVLVNVSSYTLYIQLGHFPCTKMSNILLVIKPDLAISCIYTPDGHKSCYTSVP